MEWSSVGASVPVVATSDTDYLTLELFRAATAALLIKAAPEALRVLAPLIRCKLGH